MAKLESLESAGVGLFVDLTEEREPLNPYAHLLQQAEHVRMPIVDASVPTPAHMVKILDRLDEAINHGILPYVHCWGGIGRTGTVVGCWLARHAQGDGDDAALGELKRLWADCEKSFRVDSPETAEQEAFIRNWKAGE